MSVATCEKKGLLLQVRPRGQSACLMRHNEPGKKQTTTLNQHTKKEGVEKINEINKITEEFLHAAGVDQLR